MFVSKGSVSADGRYLSHSRKEKDGDPKNVENNTAAFCFYSISAGHAQ